MEDQIKIDSPPTISAKISQHNYENQSEMESELFKCNDHVCKSCVYKETYETEKSTAQ